MNISDLKHHFLIATPALQEDCFNQAVIYLYEHNHNGAMGIIINKPMKITLGQMLSHLDITSKNELLSTQPVLMGGPIEQEQGFILHPKTGTNTPMQITLSASKELLENIVMGQGPEDFLISLGYTGWTFEQLEQEIRDNLWLVAPFCQDIMFHTSIDKRWKKTAQTLGINIINISDQSGHA